MTVILLQIIFVVLLFLVIIITGSNINITTRSINNINIISSNNY